jgi:hypothetical protein
LREKNESAESIVQLLLEHKADVNALNHKQQTPHKIAQRQSGKRKTALASVLVAHFKAQQQRAAKVHTCTGSASDVVTVQHAENTASAGTYGKTQALAQACAAQACIAEQMDADNQEVPATTTNSKVASIVDELAGMTQEQRIKHMLKAFLASEQAVHVKNINEAVNEEPESSNQPMGNVRTCGSVVSHFEQGSKNDDNKNVGDHGNSDQRADSPEHVVATVPATDAMPPEERDTAADGHQGRHV